MAGLYIHIPFCRKACYYCDFHFSTSLGRRQEIVSSIITELKQRAGELSNQKINTVYFGGGSPSVLTEEELQSIFVAIRGNYDLAESIECTFEANPDDCKKESLKAWSEIGINRLSIGVQSFRQDDLTAMNRSHNAQQAIDAIWNANECGYDAINLDLIYGFPTMPTEVWIENVRTAFELPINHLSAYSLTIEKGTALHHFVKTNKYPPLQDDKSAREYEILQDVISQKDWQQYEISNYCKGDNYAVHNTNYWKQESYLGIGPSAHSYIDGVRRWNVANNAKYISKIANGEVYWEAETLSTEDRINEAIMLGLRTKWGVDIEALQSEYGINLLTVNDEEINTNIQQGLLSLDEGKMCLTVEGKLVADHIASTLFLV